MTDEEQILGSWTHSHEEDHNEQQTFRPSSNPLPLARGRRSFTLLPGNRAVVGTPGADDRGVTYDGTWSIDHGSEGDVLKVVLPGWAETFLIVDASSEKLVLQPITPSG